MQGISLVKRPSHQPEDVWGLLTTFIAAATVGLVMFNFFHIVGLHHASIHDKPRHMVPMGKSEIPLQLLMEIRYGLTLLVAMASKGHTT